MVDSRSFQKLIIPLSFTLIVLPFLLVKVNFFKRADLYTGLIKDASDGSPLDLVRIQLGEIVSYSDRLGEYNIKQEFPPVLGFLEKGSADGKKVDIEPTPEFESPKDKTPCRLINETWFSRNFNCSVILYPQVFEVAARVLSSEAIGFLQKENEIRARKSRLWDILAPESQKLWASREEFAGFLTLKEITQVKLQAQLTSFEVSRQPTFINDYNYMGNQIGGELARVEVSVVDAAGKVSKNTLYFIKLQGLWKYLMEETPKSVADFTTRNSWVFKNQSQ